MPAGYLCDGCGQACPEPRIMGYVKKAGYCSDCAPNVEQFYAALNNLHDRLADEWRKEKALYIQTLRETIPGITLPDNQ